MSIYGRTIVLDYTAWFSWTGSHGGVDTQGQKKGRRTGPLEGVCVVLTLDLASFSFWRYNPSPAFIFYYETGYKLFRLPLNLSL